jgi:hypothetical protein
MDRKKGDMVSVSLIWIEIEQEGGSINYLLNTVITWRRLDLVEFKYEYYKSEIW